MESTGILNVICAITLNIHAILEISLNICMKDLWNAQISSGWNLLFLMALSFVQETARPLGMFSSPLHT